MLQISTLFRTAAVAIAAVSVAPSDSLAGAESRVELEPGDVVCLVGNTLAERLQLFGYFEAGLLAAHPDLGLTFRNLGWSADEIGLAPRPLDFGSLEDHLDLQDADVVLLFYGNNESFAGLDGLAGFGFEFRRFLRQLTESNDDRRWAVVSPIPQESTRAIPEVSARNATIGAYRDEMRRAATELGLAFLDIYDEVAREMAAADTPLTLNGLHLNQLGYWHASRALAESFLANTQLRVMPDGSFGLALARRPAARSVGEIYATGTPAPLAPRPGASATVFTVSAANLEPGYYALMHGEQMLALASRAEWEEGVQVVDAVLAARAEEIRRVARSKNRFFFDRYRAVNGYYIYGGRKEPFGVLSFPPEMEAFDEQVMALDRELHELASHRLMNWKLIRVDR